MKNKNVRCGTFRLHTETTPIGDAFHGTNTSDPFSTFAGRASSVFQSEFSVGALQRNFAKSFECKLLSALILCFTYLVILDKSKLFIAVLYMCVVKFSLSLLGYSHDDLRM